VSYISIIRAADTNFHYECPWSVAETLVRDDRGRYAHSPDILETVNQNFKRKRPTIKNEILSYPIPDYSHIAAKVDCWRRNDKVRVAVTCDVDHM
jgi:hypothetical protein